MMINRLKLIPVSLFALLSATIIGCSSGGGGGGSIGNGATPSLETTPPTALNFSDTARDHISTPIELTITNNNSGNANLVVSSMTLSDTVNFKIDATKGSNPCQSETPTINGGDSCTVEVTFEPSQIASFAETLTITSNDTNSPKELSLTGTGTTPIPSLQVSPLTTFDFGVVTEGNMAAPLNVTLSNNGTADLAVSSIAISDTTNFNLNLGDGSNNTCGTAAPTIAENTSCTVEVSFQPTPTGTNVTYPDNLVITSNDASSPASVSLSGTNEPVAPSITVKINQVDTDLVCPNQTVTAYVSVTDQADFPVKNLVLTDFAIEEASVALGNPDSAPNVDIVNEPVSIAIVMDNSGSLSDIDIAEMEAQATQIVNMSGLNDSFEIIKFDRNVFVVEEFTTNKTDAIAAIESTFEGTGVGTALLEAIQQAVTDANAQSTERKVIIVITDGDDTEAVDAAATSQSIIDANATNGIPIYAVAIGDNVDTAILQSIADGTSAELYEAEVSQNLATIIQQQLSEVLFVDQYILTYTSTSTGGGTVDLKITATETGPPMLTGSDNRDIARCP